MTTARRESWPVYLTTWGGEEFEGHETRITAFPTAFTHRPRQASATKSWRSYRLLCFLGHESRDTNHGFYAFPESRSTSCTALRFAVGAPCGEKADLKVAEPKTEIRRPDRRARRPLTTLLRILTGPFLDILGLLPPDYELLSPDYELLPRDNGSITRNSPQFPTIPRNSSDTPPEPLSARRPPFSLGLTTSSVGRSSRFPPGSFRCGQRQMNPCRERRTFWIAQTRQLSI